MKELTGNQETFARLVAIEKRNFTDAYREAYNPKTATKKTINEGASRVASDSNVLARIQELRSMTVEDDRTYHAMILGFLVDTLEDELLPTRTRLRASELLGRATGLFTQKVEVNNINIDARDNLKEFTIDELKVMANFLRTDETLKAEPYLVDGEAIAQQVDDIIDNYS